jgi:hypothetical protein
MTDKTEQLDEFQASMGDPSSVPEPTATKSSKRKADKEGGDKAIPKLTRSGMVGQMVGKLSGMNKEGVSSAYSTMFGKGAPDKSAANMATIKGMKEEVAEVFGNDELSEEFMERAETVFTAAVNARVAVELARLEEEFEAKAHDAQAEIEEELTAKVDQYTTYVAEQWLKDNEVAVESSIKVELAESLLGGLKSLIEDHNIAVDDEKIDLVSEAQASHEEIEARLDEETNARLNLEKEIEELKKERSIQAAGETLTVVQQEKLQSMAEGIEYDNLSDFEKKLDVIKETYFASKSIVTEEVVEEPLDEAEEKAAIDPSMERYASAISRTLIR